jgi:DNA-binding XRE family transcriptional regulator
VRQIELELDAPKSPDAPWFLDARVKGNAIVIEWRPALGFGLTSMPAAGYGDAPDEFFPTLEEAADRAMEILTKGKRTRPPAALDLRGLRERKFVTQDELAALVGVKQAAISKLERRGDEVGLAALKSIVRALGGELEVSARFAEKGVPIVLSPDPAAKSKATPRR